MSSGAGIASIALFAPVIASNAIFSARRASRGVEYIDENPLFAAANFDLAAGQVTKGGRAAKAILLATEPASAIASKGAKNMIQTTSQVGKFFTGIGEVLAKVINFTADHINPVIIGGSLLKIVGSEKKAETFGTEAPGVTCMFVTETAAKSFFGLPDFGKNSKGEMVAKPNEAKCKVVMDKIFTKEQNKAIEDFITTRKNMKYVVGGAKGLLFVGASIGGYQLGEKIAKTIIENSKNTDSNN